MPDWPTLQGVISSHAVEFLRVMAVPTHWSENARDQQHTQGLFNPHSPSPPSSLSFSTGVVPPGEVRAHILSGKGKDAICRTLSKLWKAGSDPSCPARVVQDFK